jgi:prepilin-type N-terminal cleavage/methylation domain-containing protein
MIRQQRGITLIELLATISILSFVGVIIWSVFFQGYTFSHKSMSKNSIQQEATIILTNLTKIHQTSQQYEISNTSCGITVKITKQDSSIQTQEFNHSGLCISSSYTGVVIPDQDDIHLTLNIYEIEDPTNKVNVDSFLYRLKDGGI